MASSASCKFPVIFRVRRKIFRSYLVTSSSNADTSPRFAAATNAGSSFRTTDDGKRCALGAFTWVRFWLLHRLQDTKVPRIVAKYWRFLSPYGIRCGQSPKDSEMLGHACVNETRFQRRMR